MTLRRLLVLPVLLLPLAACGGGEDEKAAYVERASGVCERAQSDFDALPQPSTPAQFGPFADGTVAIAEQAQRDLAALTPPPDDRDELQSKVLDPFVALVEEGKAFAEQVKAAGGDQVKLLPLLSSRPTTGQIDLDYLRSYGLGTCADAITLS